MKQFVVECSLVLINEFIGFISQIYGSGFQKKFKKGSISGKFDKLSRNKSFEANCHEFSVTKVT